MHQKGDRRKGRARVSGTDSRPRDNPDGTLGDPSTGAPANHEIAPCGLTDQARVHLKEI